MLEPYPDVLLDEIADRAVLVLRDVLGFQTVEVANILDTTESEVTSALTRARDSMKHALPDPERDGPPLPNSPHERRIVDDFASAFEAGDVDAVVALLTDDAWLTMPPLELAYQGHEAIRNFLATVVLCDDRRYVLIPTRANRQPAFGCYERDQRMPILHAQGLLVLTLSGDRIAAMTRFHDNSLLTMFGLPRSLRAKGEL